MLVKHGSMIYNEELGYRENTAAYDSSSLTNPFFLVRSSFFPDVHHFAGFYYVDHFIIIKTSRYTFPFRTFIQWESVHFASLASDSLAVIFFLSLSILQSSVHYNRNTRCFNEGELAFASWILM